MPFDAATLIVTEHFECVDRVAKNSFGCRSNETTIFQCSRMVTDANGYFKVFRRFWVRLAAAVEMGNHTVGIVAFVVGEQLFLASDAEKDNE